MRQLTDFDLALVEDDERLVLEGRQILRRVMNVARKELEDIHVEAQKKGEVVRVTVDAGAIQKLLLAAAKKELSQNKIKELAKSVSDDDSS